MMLLKVLSPFPLLLAQSSALALPPNEYPQETLAQPQEATGQIYQPRVGSRFQIVLNRGDYGRRGSSSLLQSDAEVLDLDLFDTSADTIQKLHSQGKKVICYFSAGSSESWRKDFTKFEAKDKGDKLRGWARENWLDMRSPNVWVSQTSRTEISLSSY
jgi:hypothetical protein